MYVPIVARMKRSGIRELSKIRKTMKKFKIVSASVALLILGLSLVGLSFAQAQPAIFFEPQKPILLSKNQTRFTLQLKANPTTGYSWYINSYTTPGLRLVKYAFTPDQSGKIGAGGVASWDFVVEKTALIAPSLLKVDLTYARPWNVTDQPVKRTVTILTSQ